MLLFQACVNYLISLFNDLVNRHLKTKETQGNTRSQTTQPDACCCPNLELTDVVLLKNEQSRRNKAVEHDRAQIHFLFVYQRSQDATYAWKLIFVQDEHGNLSLFMMTGCLLAGWLAGCWLAGYIRAKSVAALVWSTTNSTPE